MKVAVVGLGGIGQRHVRNLRRLCGSSIEVIACRSRKLAHVLTDRLEVAPGLDLAGTYDLREVDDLADAIERGPDAILICTPTSHHVPAALEAVRAGVAVFVEKPLSHSWAGVDPLLEAAARHRVVGLVGCQMRFHPCLRRLKTLIDSRAVGRVIVVNALVGDYLPQWHAYEDYRTLYASRRELGGGVILTQIHELDYLAWLFGQPTRVFAIGGHLSDLDINVEDTASLLCEHRPDGRMVPVHVHQDFRRRPPARTCEVVGEGGTIHVDFHAATVRVTDAAGAVVEASSWAGYDRNEMFVDEMAHFLACVRGEATPGVSLEDGARSLRVALAALESIETGAPVVI